MSPPYLARDAPRLDIFEPIEIGFLPIFWNETGLAITHRGERRFRQNLSVDIPLLGQPRLNDGAGSVAMRHHMRVRLNLIDEPTHPHHLDNAFTCLEAIEATKIS